MPDTKMQLEDCMWKLCLKILVLTSIGLDDLCVRFIINLPREELESVERICFQVEEAQWFYEDFIRPLDPNLPSMTLRVFALRIFQHCPLMSQWSHSHHSAAFSEFLAYKTRVPVRGAILLNDEMDAVVLVKGWKKSANWSFPRGKINKDEKDLDCAIREVYEETGFDIREAGLVKDKSKVKSIEIPMREQNMRLYVLRGVPKDTHFEPKTRREISRIQWYKLSDLPTLKKNRQADSELPNPNKFYMVAPFLVPLRKWIAQQKKLDSKNNAHQDSAAELMTEDEDALGKSPGPVFSELPEVSIADDPSTHLKKLLNITGPAVPTPSPSYKKDVSKGNALLALLRNGSPYAPESRPSANSPEDRDTPLTPDHSIPIPNVQQSFPMYSHVPNSLNAVATAPIHDISSSQSRPIEGMQPLGVPTRFSYQPYRDMSSASFHNLPDSSSGNQVLVQNQERLPQPFTLSSFTNPQFSSPLPTHLPTQISSTAPLARPAKAAPYQQTGDPEFVSQQDGTLPLVPPASKLPPPKLTTHSLGLLNMLKGARAMQGTGKNVSTPASTISPLENTSTGSRNQNRNSLFNLLSQKHSLPIPASAAAELSATSPTVSGKEHAQASSPPAQYEQSSMPTTSRPPSTNLPSNRRRGNSRSGKKPQNTQKPQTPQKPITILPRPASAKRDAEPRAPESSFPNSSMKFPGPKQPFKPKILRRPVVEEDFEANLPTRTVAVSSFSNRKPTLEENESTSPPKLHPASRPSQTATQRETLLSLFGKPSPVNSQANSVTAKSPASAASSPFIGSDPAEFARSKGPLSSAVSVEATRSKDTSPVDKAFLLGYLNGVAKGKH